MGDGNFRRRALVRGSLGFGILFALLHLANLVEVMSHASRPLVVWAARLIGLEAGTDGTDILLSDLTLPWTQDCSGVNGLIVLWGITAWARRHQPLGLGFVVSMLLCVPVALLANLCRILTLAAYRGAFYPAWESEQLHYLIGFLWLLPCAVIFVEDLRRADPVAWLEAIYIAMVLALLGPVVFAPGGSWVALTALFYLAHNRVTARNPVYLALGYLAWGLAAILIAVARMESLWIPWLLLCPRFASRELLGSWSGLLVLSGTVSLLAMRPEWQWVLLAAFAHRLYCLAFVGSSTERPPATGSWRLRSAEFAVLALVVASPFALPEIVGHAHVVESPPRGVMARQVTVNTFELRFAGQPPDVRMFWYGAYGDGRHHSLVACMRFRGVVLEPSVEPNVYEGSGKWMREFFVTEGVLRVSYPEYVRATFSPFADAGIHLIVEAPSDQMSAAYFSRATEQLLNGAGLMASGAGGR